MSTGVDGSTAASDGGSGGSAGAGRMFHTRGGSSNYRVVATGTTSPTGGVRRTNGDGGATEMADLPGAPQPAPTATAVAGATPAPATSSGSNSASSSGNGNGDANRATATATATATAGGGDDVASLQRMIVSAAQPHAQVHPKQATGVVIGHVTVAKANHNSTGERAAAPPALGTTHPELSCLCCVSTPTPLPPANSDSFRWIPTFTLLSNTQKWWMVTGFGLYPRRLSGGGGGGGSGGASARGSARGTGTVYAIADGAEASNLTWRHDAIWYAMWFMIVAGLVLLVYDAIHIFGSYVGTFCALSPFVWFFRWPLLTTVINDPVLNRSLIYVRDTLPAAGAARAGAAPRSQRTAAEEKEALFTAAAAAGSRGAAGGVVVDTDAAVSSDPSVWASVHAPDLLGKLASCGDGLRMPNFWNIVLVGLYMYAQLDVGGGPNSPTLWRSIVGLILDFVARLPTIMISIYVGCLETSISYSLTQFMSEMKRAAAAAALPPGIRSRKPVLSSTDAYYWSAHLTEQIHRFNVLQMDKCWALGVATDIASISLALYQYLDNGGHVINPVIAGLILYWLIGTLTAQCDRNAKLHEFAIQFRIARANALALAAASKDSSGTDSAEFDRLSELTSRAHVSGWMTRLYGVGLTYQNIACLILLVGSVALIMNPHAIGAEKYGKAPF